MVCRWILWIVWGQTNIPLKLILEKLCIFCLGKGQMFRHKLAEVKCCSPVDFILNFPGKCIPVENITVPSRQCFCWVLCWHRPLPHGGRQSQNSNTGRMVVNPARRIPPNSQRRGSEWVGFWLVYRQESIFYVPSLKNINFFKNSKQNSESNAKLRLFILSVRVKIFANLL